MLGAGALNLLGRSGAPLCDPGSLVQGHALWHVLTATVLGLYGYLAFPSLQPAADRPPGIGH